MQLLSAASAKKKMQKPQIGLIIADKVRLQVNKCILLIRRALIIWAVSLIMMHVRFAERTEPIISHPDPALPNRRAQRRRRPLSL